MYPGIITYPEITELWKHSLHVNFPFSARKTVLPHHQSKDTNPKGHLLLTGMPAQTKQHFHSVHLAICLAS